MAIELKKLDIVGSGSPALFGANPSALIFNHIHKCAGTTFESMLRQKFHDSFHCAGFLSSWLALKRALDRADGSTLAIAGHAAWGTHELLPPNYRAFYVTILREPFSRFLSAYRFARLRGSRHTTPAEYLSCCSCNLKHNVMVKLIGNGDLQLAKKRLSSTYLLFGLVERFDDFLVELGNLTHIPFAPFVVQNRTGGVRHPTAPGLRADFERLNDDDCELYRWAVSEWERRFPARHTNASPSLPPSTFEPAGASEPFGDEISRLIDEDRIEDAAHVLERIDSPTPSHHLYRARIYERLNSFARALQAYTEAARLDVENTIYLAAFLERHRLFPNAADVLAQAIAEVSQIDVSTPDAYPARFRQRAHAQMEQVLSSCALPRGPVTTANRLTVAIHDLPANTRYAIYGTGKVAQRLLAAADSGAIPAPAFLIDDNAAAKDNTAPVCNVSALHADSIDIIALATDTFQDAMWNRIADKLGPGFPVLDVRSLAGPPSAATPPLSIYHCCAHKTGSQWIRHLFGDPRITERLGLSIYDYEKALFKGLDTRLIPQRKFGAAFPPRSIATPLYLSLPGFQSIPKPGSYRAFYVFRDPRDIITSLYFSMLYSHPLMGNVSDTRRTLEGLSKTEGINLLIHEWADTGYYECLRSWVGASEQNPNLLFVRYEDLVGPAAVLHFDRLFRHCGLALSGNDLCGLLHDHSFDAKTGRQQGQEDVHAHLRKGIAGDWKNHFDGNNCREFHALAGTLVEELGYET